MAKTSRICLTSLFIAVTVVFSSGWVQLPSELQAYDNHLFVSPSGIGTTCSQSDPCNYATALSLATSGDTTIFFAGGTYAPGGNPIMNITKNLILKGGWSGLGSILIVDPDKYETIISGGGERRLITLNPGIGGYVEVTGFTLKDGYSNPYAGAIFIQTGRSYIHDNKFLRNEGTSFGGAIYVESEEASSISYNVFQQNEAGNGGGAINLGQESDVLIGFNTFTDNITGSYGAAINVDNGSTHIEGNWFSENSGEESIMISSTEAYDNSVNIVNNMILHTTYASTPDWGYGLRIQGQNNNVFYVYNNTIGYNRSGIECSDTIELVVSNNIFYNNYSTIRSYGNPELTGTSNVFYLYTINDTPLNSPYYFDPKFLDPTNDDFHLGRNSQAIDLATNVGLRYDFEGNKRPIGEGYDIGADEALLMTFLPLIIK